MKCVFYYVFFFLKTAATPKSDGAVFHTGCGAFELSRGTSNFYFNHFDVTASCFVALFTLRQTKALYLLKREKR